MPDFKIVGEAAYASLVPPIHSKPLRRMRPTRQAARTRTRPTTTRARATHMRIGALRTKASATAPFTAVKPSIGAVAGSRPQGSGTERVNDGA